MSDTPNLISPEDARLNKVLHDAEEYYGETGRNFADNVRLLCRDNKYSSLLDYGAGKGALKRKLEEIGADLDVREYDPAMPGMDALPEPADVVACFDVMEHVEPDFIDNLLTHIRDLADKCAVFTISDRKSGQTLEDGRNAHLTIEGHDWRSERLSPYFKIIFSQDVMVDNGMRAGCHFYIALPIKG